MLRFTHIHKPNGPRFISLTVRSDRKKSNTGQLQVWSHVEINKVHTKVQFYATILLVITEQALIADHHYEQRQTWGEKKGGKEKVVTVLKRTVKDSSESANYPPPPRTHTHKFINWLSLQSPARISFQYSLRFDLIAHWPTRERRWTLWHYKCMWWQTVPLFGKSK